MSKKVKERKRVGSKSFDPDNVCPRNGREDNREGEPKRAREMVIAYKKESREAHVHQHDLALRNHDGVRAIWIVHPGSTSCRRRSSAPGGARAPSVDVCVGCVARGHRTPELS